MLESQDARTDQGLLMDQVGRAPSKPILQLGTEAQSLPFLLRQQGFSEQESHMLRTLQRQKKLRKTLSCRAVVDLGAGGAGKSGRVLEPTHQAGRNHRMLFWLPPVGQPPSRVSDQPTCSLGRVTRAGSKP